MFWLLIIGIVVGLFVHSSVKVARGDGYLPDLEDEGDRQGFFCKPAPQAP